MFPKEEKNFRNGFKSFHEFLVYHGCICEIKMVSILSSHQCKMEQKESEWLFFFKEKNVLFFFTFIMKIQVLVKKKRRFFLTLKKVNFSSLMHCCQKQKVLFFLHLQVLNSLKWKWKHWVLPLQRHLAFTWIKSECLA